MKNLKILAAVAISAMAFTACEKENMNPAPASEDTQVELAGESKVLPSAAERSAAAEQLATYKGTWRVVSVQPLGGTEMPTSTMDLNKLFDPVTNSNSNLENAETVTFDGRKGAVFASANEQYKVKIGNYFLAGVLLRNQLIYNLGANVPKGRKGVRLATIISPADGKMRITSIRASEKVQYTLEKE